MKINIIKTNVNDIIHTRLSTAQYGIGWNGSISHGTVYTDLSAPLTTRNKIGVLLMVSIHTRKFKHPLGSQPLVDNNISWGARVVHDGYKIGMQKKIGPLKSFLIANIEDERVLSALALIPDQCRGSDLINQPDNVCGKCNDYLRSECERCLRDSTGLALDGIDPNKCGFNSDYEIFDFIKRSLIEGSLIKRKLLIKTRWESIAMDSDMFFWRDLQKRISKTIDHGLHNSKEFFEWFRDYDITEYGANVKTSLLLRLIVATMGFNLYPVWCGIPLCVQTARLPNKMISFIYKRL